MIDRNHDEPAADAFGDLDALLNQFDALTDTEAPSGYVELMSRVTSPDFRRRCGLICH